MDGTKFMAAAIPFKGENPWRALLNHKCGIKKPYPLEAVMTLPATGSEMNFYAVISKRSTDEKFSMGSPVLYPQFSILDPETTFFST